MFVGPLLAKSTIEEEIDWETLKSLIEHVYELFRLRRIKFGDAVEPYPGFATNTRGRGYGNLGVKRSSLYCL